MHARTPLRLCAAVRPLNALSLLETVRRDPGMTSAYYANRYFGGNKLMEVNHLLWNDLKRHGKVVVERGAAETAPQWLPVLVVPRPHRVKMHRAEDEDLSVLQAAQSDAFGAAPEDPHAPDGPKAELSEAEEAQLALALEASIVRLVHAHPDKDIQFYIHQLPEESRAVAPAAFKRLREAGIIQREATVQGTFVWH
ncbi:hypothetical protein STCU_02260 [Strigomonas culicis]|uniref:Uncharacterized protein n=1 Tax=Strigomonas culicis TaxID=28005 RepID=S9UWW6_9TRYP|nr:hypothetical protein STCU_02260 [Strigomonas culicis]|eukprot:EPY33368.1 hypothetical protein STCU_02260 [Strigomonas culicis]